jgi:hypothetical protein
VDHAGHSGSILQADHEGHSGSIQDAILQIETDHDGLIQHVDSHILSTDSSPHAAQEQKTVLQKAQGSTHTHESTPAHEEAAAVSVGTPVHEAAAAVSVGSMAEVGLLKF